MSRARRIAHRRLVAHSQRQRRYARRNAECRQLHWRKLLASMTCTEWMRPVNRAVREAAVYVRCREHRGATLESVAAITMNEEHELRDSAALQLLIESRLKAAIRTLKRALVPRRYRREFA